MTRRHRDLPSGQSRNRRNHQTHRSASTRNLTHVIAPDDPHTVSANMTSSRRLSRTTTSPFADGNRPLDRTPSLWIDSEGTSTRLKSPVNISSHTLSVVPVDDVARRKVSALAALIARFRENEAPSFRSCTVKSSMEGEAQKQVGLCTSGGALLASATVTNASSLVVPSLLRRVWKRHENFQPFAALLGQTVRCCQIVHAE